MPKTIAVGRWSAGSVRFPTASPPVLPVEPDGAEVVARDAHGRLHEEPLTAEPRVTAGTLTGLDGLPPGTLELPPYGVVVAELTA
ncbi:hypothetical protein [Streptomyces sp. WMMB 714]|uniref:hypothetical protein n=1 Tax=Streptomyces sp. WMMB 714 TaxID=1286822 RepID=UPI0005F7A79E|nr:hypothetical protein [Streptomyces sp. WMMB 714]